MATAAIDRIDGVGRFFELLRSESLADEPRRENIVWHDAAVTREDRERLLGQRGVVVWLTGLSGSGKSTVANELDRRLHARSRMTMLLDGDNIRHGLCAPPAVLRETFGEIHATRFGLGFGDDDRTENIRRVSHLATLLSGSGIITITAFVSPLRADRDRARQYAEAERPGSFVEVFIDTPIEVCEQRDPKGLYEKARRGEIADFTGVSSPYEAPLSPELRLDGSTATPEELALKIEDHLGSVGVL